MYLAHRYTSFALWYLYTELARSPSDSPARAPQTVLQSSEKTLALYRWMATMERKAVESCNA